MSLSTLWRDYWGRSGSSKDYQLSYSNNWRRISYILAASQAYDENHHEEKRFNIFYIDSPLIGVMTLRRLVGKYICLTQRRLMIRGLPQIIRDYQEPLEAGISLTMGST
ncbi:fimbria/pilus outer membrane usher protein [Escherichia coli]|nr:fimbria/pilus outer membrane usher protein [Escherichia coli]